MSMAGAHFAVDPQTVVGRELSRQTARVEPLRLKFFLNTIGEKDPVYHDSAAARRAGFRDIPIPPTYLFCLQSLDNPGSLEVLDILGIDIGRILHGEQKFVFHKPACVGDEVIFTTRVGPIVHKKGGALTMIAQEIRVENGEGEHIADITNTTVVRNPSSSGGGLMNVKHATLKVGDTPVQRVFGPITRHELALYCGASGDHNPIHVDSDFARASGFPDVFAHGMFVMARLGMALNDAFPVSSIREYGVRFVSITQVGAEISCAGVVTAIEEVNGERRARIELTARDQNNDIKLKGEAVVALPCAAGANMENAHG